MGQEHPQPHQGMGHSGGGGHSHPWHFPRDRSPPVSPRGTQNPTAQGPPDPPPGAPRAVPVVKRCLGGPSGWGGLTLAGDDWVRERAGWGRARTPRGAAGKSCSGASGYTWGQRGGGDESRQGTRGGGVTARGRRGQGDREGGNESPTLTSHRCGSQGPQNWGRGHKAGLGGEQGARGARVGVGGGV